jgi:PDZ domain-containing secreted protein
MKQKTKWITLLALLASFGLSQSAISADKEKENENEKEMLQAEVDKKLADAQKRLAEAAKEVAQLSMSRSKDAMPYVHFRLNRGVLGAVVDKTDKDSKGVSIISVSPGGGAEAAGLRTGDLITSINGKSLSGKEGNRKLVDELQSAKPGDKVAVGYERDGKSVKVDVEVKEPNKGFAFNFDMSDFGEQMAKKFGEGPANQRMERRFYFRDGGGFGAAELVPMSAKLGQYFGTEKGLLVVRAPHDARFMLEEGDVILDIDGRVPSDPGHALRILSSYQAGEKVKINVMRMKKRQTLEVTLPKDEPGKHRASFVLPFVPEIDELPELPELPEMPPMPTTDIT